MASPRKRMWRRLAVIATLTALAGAITVVATIGTAHAATCSGWSSNYINGNGGSAWVYVSTNCSDGETHIQGHVFDTACDGTRVSWFQPGSIDRAERV